MATQDQSHGKVFLKGLSTDTKPTENVVAGSIYYETDTNDLYEFFGTTWQKIRTDGAINVANDGYFPDSAVTGGGRHINDVANYTAHATQGAVATDEVSRVEWTAAELVTALRITCWSNSTTTTDFQGVYVSFNQTSGAGEDAALASTGGTSTDHPRYWVPKNTVCWFKVTGTTFTSASFVAIDNNTTPDNNVDIAVF